MVQEARVLVGEPVVVLLPNVGGEQVVQRGDVAPPGKLRCDLEPFGVLVEHRVDDVDECLVAVEQPVSSGEQVPLEPAFTLVLTCLLYTSPSPRDGLLSRMPSSA